MIHAAIMFQTLENQASFSKINPAADINVMKDRMTLGLKMGSPSPIPSTASPKT